MIDGTVTANREIVIRLDVHATHQSPLSIQTVVDTGFNGFLTLPIDVLRTSEASPAGTRRVELGNGKVVELAVYVAKVRWHDDEREVLVLQSEATPLVGMSLLWGSRVGFEAQDSGTVTIETIS